MYGKILIQCVLTVRTGLHIGGSSTFSAIGAVDSPVIRDAYSGLPIVPGSSLKGKLRTLLVRSSCGSIEHMPKIEEDPPEIKNLFGSANPVIPSRLQFSDCFVRNAAEMRKVGITEVKTENAITRNDSTANPRQIERVTAGTEFTVNIVYDVSGAVSVEDDFRLLSKGMKLLQLDYLGGHGSRGSGRVSLNHFVLTGFETELDMGALTKLFDEVSDYELFPSSASV